MQTNTLIKNSAPSALKRKEVIRPFFDNNREIYNFDIFVKDKKTHWKAKDAKTDKWMYGTFIRVINCTGSWPVISKENLDCEPYPNFKLI